MNILQSYHLYMYINSCSMQVCSRMYSFGWHASALWGKRHLWHGMVYQCFQSFVIYIFRRSIFTALLIMSSTMMFAQRHICMLMLCGMLCMFVSRVSQYYCLGCQVTTLSSTRIKKCNQFFLIVVHNQLTSQNSYLLVKSKDVVFRSVLM